jgi:hypothetical protein
MTTSAMDVAREMERIIDANRHTLMRQPSHTGIPRLVILAEDLVKILQREDRKTFQKY